MPIEFRFNASKTLEAILYLAHRVSAPTYMKLAKLLYFADNALLEAYGLLITGDAYLAMEHGPVPSNAYRMMKEKEGAAEPHEDFEVYNGYHIRPLREANLDKLSQADKECLDLIISQFGQWPAAQLRQLSHDEAWREAWNNRGDKNAAPIPIEAIALQFEDGEALLDYLEHRYD